MTLIRVVSSDSCRPAEFDALRHEHPLLLCSACVACPPVSTPLLLISTDTHQYVAGICVDGCVDPGLQLERGRSTCTLTGTQTLTKMFRLLGNVSGVGASVAVSTDLDGTKPTGRDRRRVVRAPQTPLRVYVCVCAYIRACMWHACARGCVHVLTCMCAWVCVCLCAWAGFVSVIALACPFTAFACRTTPGASLLAAPSSGVSSGTAAHPKQVHRWNEPSRFSSRVFRDSIPSFTRAALFGPASGSARTAHPNLIWLVHGALSVGSIVPWKSRGSTLGHGGSRGRNLGGLPPLRETPRKRAPPTSHWGAPPPRPFPAKFWAVPPLPDPPGHKLGLVRLSRLIGLPIDGKQL